MTQPSRLVLSGLWLASIVLSAPVSAAVSRPAEALLSRADAWTRENVLAIGQVRGDATPLESAANILAVYASAGDPFTLRVSLVAPVGIRDGVAWYRTGEVRTLVLLDDGTGGESSLPAPLRGLAPIRWDRMLLLDADALGGGVYGRGAGALAAMPGGSTRFHLDRGWIAAALPAGAPAPRRIAVITYSGDRVLDRLVATTTPLAPSGQANVAFAHHANQGLTYTTNFSGRPGAESSSGYDEILRVHQTLNVPGNFHLGSLLRSAAQWDKNNGAPVDFNAWLKTGGTAGWACLMTSAYGQPITPFLQGAMNDWAIDRDAAQVQTLYGYTPRVAWVPERVWLTPAQYPGNGVIDGSAGRWKSHGVDGVILDDWPHCSGHDNHRIHFVPGNGLRVIPRDGNFTGKLHSGDGAGALQLLTDIANSGLGQYRIVTYADDWEMAAAVSGWETTFPFAYGTYQWMIGKCSTESAWLHTWKLDAALSNPDFNGDTFTPANGTYGGIGDVNGYGGSNNAWYTDWAGYIPYANGGNGSGGCAGGAGNCKNYGTLWNDAHFALQGAPDNGIREAGWYVMMTNLHETAWHDYLGGPLSGWVRQYASHIKNANVYAEGARWAGGLFANPTGAYLGDIDDDGINELVMYNDRLMAVFESTGGRCVWLFAKGSGYGYSVIGSDNTYWYGTEADFNDGNHVGGLSDVGPNHQNDPYAMTVDAGTGTTVQATFTQSGVTKTVKLTLGQPYLDCIYRVGANTQYLQAGFSPDLVDLVYNASMTRLWGGSTRSYAGQRNPNTGASAAFVLGGGGASHNLNFTGTLMKADEIAGTQKFEFYLFGGATSTPDVNGRVPELDALAAGLGDALAPEAQRGTFFPATRQLALVFDEPVRAGEVTVTGIAIDDDDNGTAEVTLDGGCTVLTTGNASTITLQLSTTAANAIVALPNHNTMRLLLSAGAVKDAAGNPIATLTHTGNVMVSYGPPTLITLDGRFDPSEWPACAVAVADSFDSQWNAAPNNVTNEIQALYATWDSTYLYLGIRGIVTGNSWLLYLDTDPGGASGQTDLRAINAWERGVQFSAPGFKADWEYGAYQHQGAFDSQSFFRITGPTTTVNYSDSVLKAFDPGHAYGLNGGSEIAIPWSALYGLGAGHVPANATLGMVATLCWDPEPNGEAGGDQAPSNTGGVLPPMLNNRVLVTLDANGDGVPDPVDRTAPSLVSAVVSAGDSVVTLQFSENVTAATANQATRYAIYETASPANTVPVVSATLQGDQKTVVLKVIGMLNRAYTAAANGVADQSCFANAAQTTAAFSGPPVDVGPAPAPLTFALARPFPNPATGGVTLRFSVPAGGSAAALELFDLTGRRVRTLASGRFAAGMQTMRLERTDAHGLRLAPGLYFVRLSRGSENRVERLVLLP